MEVIHDSPYDYKLYRKDGNLWMSVECGRSAVFTVDFPMSPTEVKAYEKDGKSWLSTLADYVRSDPDSYFKRGK